MDDFSFLIHGELIKLCTWNLRFKKDVNYELTGIETKKYVADLFFSLHI